MERATSDWPADQLREMGLRPEYRDFTAPQLQLRAARLMASGASVEVFPDWLPRATAHPVRAPRVAAAGVPDGSLRGRIALIEPRAGGRRKRAAVYRVLAGAGGAGIVAIDDGAEGWLRVEDLPHPAEPAPMPVLLGGRKDRAALLDAARCGGVAELKISGEFDARAAARNVIATAGRGRRQVVVSTPYGGWFRCGGAQGSGIAVWLALAQWAAERPSETAYAFAANSSHELGYAGRRAFLDSHAPVKEDVAAWLHLGASVTLPESRPSGAARGAIAVGKACVGGRLRCVVPGRSRSRLDSRQPRRRAFADAAGGYAAINLAGGGNRFMHSPADGHETTGPAAQEPVAGALMKMLERFG